MPEQKFISDYAAIPVGTSDYPELTGREIFEEQSYTGLNKSTPETLEAFIAGDSEIKPVGNPEWPLIPVEVMSEQLLVDGSFALRLMPETEDELYLFLRDCVTIKKRLVVQRIRDEKGHITEIVRVYQKTEKDWLVRDIKNYGGDHEQTVERWVYPLDAFIAYPHGKGILEPNRKTYQRIEEIEEGIRAQTGPASLSLIVTGYLGDVKKAQETFNKGAQIVYVPGNATVTRVASNNTADQLIKEGDKLIKLWLKNTHVVEISETSTMSGVARRLAMTPMLHFVKLIRNSLIEIYDMIGYTIDFGGLGILTPMEIEEELELLKRGRDEGFIDEEIYKRKGTKLFV